MPMLNEVPGAVLELDANSLAVPVGDTIGEARVDTLDMQTESPARQVGK